MTRIAIAIVLAALMISIKMNDLIEALGNIKVNQTTRIKYEATP